MRRAIGILLLTGQLLFLVWPLPALAGGIQQTGTAPRRAVLRADFNGDTRADLAIGAPGENLSAGAVHVLYGSATRLTTAGSQFWWQDSPGIAGTTEPGDRFGEALAAGDLNGDTRADLVIGAPGENLSAGIVHVLYGSATGLTAAGSQFWWQDSPGILNSTEPGDDFGEALAAGDFNGDTRADLAIGVPGEDLLVGAVHVLHGSATGLTTAGNEFWWQDRPGIASVNEPDDRFGFVLAAGDFNGDTRSDLVIGAPGEDLFAGAFHVLYGSATVGLTAAGSQFWWQDSPGIASNTDSGDRFGEALAAGDFNGDTRADLAVGVPGETFDAILHTGLVHVLYGSATVGLTAAGSQFWWQDSPGIAGVAEDADSFGGAVAAGTLSISGAGTANPAATSPAERTRAADASQAGIPASLRTA